MNNEKRVKKKILEEKAHGEKLTECEARMLAYSPTGTAAGLLSRSPGALHMTWSEGKMPPESTNLKDYYARLRASNPSNLAVESYVSEGAVTSRLKREAIGVCRGNPVEVFALWLKP